MKSIIVKILATVTILVFTNNLYSQNVDLRTIDIEKFKAKCYEKFCKKGNDQNCKEKMKNLELIISHIKSDKRITNLGIASFFLATVYTETEIKNFAPTKEVKYAGNKDRTYWKLDPVTGKQYFGRGWFQLTHKENYKKATDSLKIDFLNNPDLVLEPKNAYEILYLSTMSGLLETYRSSENGAAGTTRIKLTDFLEYKEGEEAILDYSLVRAVINANGGKSKRFEFKKGCFIPKSENLDASEKTENMCIFFENALRYSLTKDKIKPTDIKSLQLLDNNVSATFGCFIYNLNMDVYADLAPDKKYIYLNIDGYNEIFKRIPTIEKNDKKKSIGLTNGEYKIYITNTDKVAEAFKETEGSEYVTTDYKVIIYYKNKKYEDEVIGHCQN